VVGDKSRAEITETIRGAIKDAGSVLLAVAALAALALGLAVGALIVATRAARAVTS
jgi:hypothetical protein